MSVIINEFEILVDPPTPRAPEVAAPVTQVASPLRPEEIERIVRHFEARHQRVAAD